MPSKPRKPSSETNRFLRAALFYALRLGWPVFLLRKKMKGPLTKHGFNEARIRKWWARLVKFSSRAAADRFREQMLAALDKHLAGARP